MSGAGDVDGDGFADLIVGATGDDNNGDGSGSARVFSGADGSVLYTFSGDLRIDSFGASVSGVGDVNGDGLADFIVGARGTFKFRQDNFAGYARLFVSQVATGLPTLLGDVDQDGEVTSGDIAPFIEVLQTGSFLAEADCNEDGVINFADIAPFIEILMAG